MTAIPTTSGRSSQSRRAIASSEACATSRRRPAAGRGRDPRPLVGRQLQGRPRDDRRRQGRPDQPAHPGDRPGRARSSPARTRPSRRAARSSPTATSWASAGTAASRSTRACRPAGWCRCPPTLTPRLAMALGTAGFTAALSVIRLEERGLRPGTGPVLVTGASGGLGSVAVGILAARGYEVVAATGKPDEADRLRGLGAADGDRPRGGDGRERTTARGGALGGRRGLRGRRDAPLRPPHAPARRDGRGLGQRGRAGLRDDGLPVHPARRGAARASTPPRSRSPSGARSGRGSATTCARTASARA